LFDLSQDLRTNTQSEGPNAVTWGVFPGKEIIQPTIVEAVSFIAWKDEAFAIGSQWARLYPDGSKSRALIEGIMDSYYLVNVRPFTPPPPPLPSQSFSCSSPLLAIPLSPETEYASSFLLGSRGLAGRSQCLQGEGGHLCAL